MITTSERRIFKKAIGFGHIKKIQKFFVDADIRRADGKEYSASHISNVFNGVEHEEIEAGIFLCAQWYKEEAKKEARLKKQILKKLKTA